MGRAAGYKCDRELVERRAASLRRPLSVRFERHVQPEPNTGCWLWDGSLDHNGYGQMRVDGLGKMATHISLKLVGIDVPKGMYACHKCDIPACVNPDHLFVGTAKENARDCMKKGRNSLPPVHLGERNNAAILTLEKVQAIRVLLENNFSQRACARILGVSLTIIWNVASKRTWKHVV